MALDLMVLDLMMFVSGVLQVVVVYQLVFSRSWSWSFRRFFRWSWGFETDHRFSSTGYLGFGSDTVIWSSLSCTEMLQVCCASQQPQVSSGNLERRAISQSEAIYLCESSHHSESDPNHSSPDLDQDLDSSSRWVTAGTKSFQGEIQISSDKLFKSN